MTPILSDAVFVRGRFHRSVQIERDWVSDQHLSGYLLTPNARGVANRIVEGLFSPQGPRAWSMVGPYGSGKSSFTLFLTDVLASAQAQTTEGRLLQSQMPSTAPRLFPLLVVGRRASLRQTLYNALLQALQQHAPDQIDLMKDVEPDRLAGAFERVASGLTEHGYDGLLVVLDEFGKFLEYAALENQHDELFLMQELAEAAERSTAPMVLLTILHTSFADYLGRDAGAARTEWQKVQGRFSDVRFHEPPEQFLKLIGNALTVDASLQNKYHYLQGVLEEHPALQEARRRIPELPKLLEACLPLEPLTALLLWPLFRSKMAQNERSLFGFLTSTEPNGLSEFLRHHDTTEDELPLYRLDALYDYVMQSLGNAVHQRDLTVRWSLLENACERVPVDAPSHSLELVKAIGLLSSYGTEVGLRSTAATLQFAFGKAIDVETALDFLQRRSIVIYRAYDESYALWDGSDVDLELEFNRAEQRAAAFSPAASLSRHAELQPMLARAHYIRTGTLRSFTARVMDAAEAAQLFADTQPVEEATLTFVLTQNAEERSNLIKKAERFSRKNVLQIWAFPLSLLGLEQSLRDLDTWERVRDEVQALAGDPVARSELAGRQSQAQEHLEALIGQIFGLRGHRFDPTTSTWVQSGKVQPLRTARNWVSWLSELCDKAYPKAPELHNELINRTLLSSQTVKARRNLIEAMLNSPNQADLGIMGQPPELSMYRSVLHEGGIHVATPTGWRFTAPETGWTFAWKAMETFLQSTHTGRRSISELFSLLQAPPFGLRQGPLPVLLTASLLVHRDTVALFDDGLFVSELRIEVLERLMRRPELFEIQQFSFEPQHVQTLQQAREALEQFQGSVFVDNSTIVGLLDVVKPLVLMVGHLPPYTRHTRQLNPPYAANLRELLTRATDPSELLFERLTALHSETASQGQSLANWLLEGLQALSNAYPQLLDGIEAQLRRWLHLNGSAVEIRKQLQERAKPLLGYSTDPTLVALIRQAASDNSSEWRESIGRVVSGGKPTRDWRDADLAQFPLRLERLALDFHRLEELIAARGDATDTYVLRIDSLDVSMESNLMVLTLNESQRSEAYQLSESLLQLLEETPEHDSDVVLASVANLARTLLLRQKND